MVGINTIYYNMWDGTLGPQRLRLNFALVVLDPGIGNQSFVYPSVGSYCVAACPTCDDKYQSMTQPECHVSFNTPHITLIILLAHSDSTRQ
eukprot:COSAG01_NODE_4741_length_4773_cov_31.477963_6_plen_91_part_00